MNTKKTGVRAKTGGKKRPPKWFVRTFQSLKPPPLLPVDMEYVSCPRPPERKN